MTRVVGRLALISLPIVVLGLAAAGCKSDPASSAIELGAGQSYGGVQTLPAMRLPDITLTTTGGEPYNLRRDSQGLVTLVAFGFTHCENECPVEMGRLAATLGALDREVLERTRALFVTTDPERDTPEAIRTWLDTFDAPIVGLTGTRAQINAVQTQLGLNTASRTEEGDHADAEGHQTYAVAHSTFLYVFAPNDGRAHLVYPPDIGATTLTADVTRLARDGWQEERKAP